MKIKKLNDKVIIPTKAYAGDAGFDVYSPVSFYILPNKQLQIKLGFVIEIAEDEVCIMSERSGMAIKKCITSIGNIIDSGYRGEVSIILYNGGNSIAEFGQGDKIGQMIIHKLGNQNIEVVKELSESQRGKNAHYSSGK
jgi:dUTP pyrophosphatase